MQYYNSLELTILLYLIKSNRYVNDVDITPSGVVKDSNTRNCRLQRFMRSVWETQNAGRIPRQECEVAICSNQSPETEIDGCKNPYEEFDYEYSTKTCGECRSIPRHDLRNASPCRRAPTSNCDDEAYNSSSGLRRALRKAKECRNKYRKLKKYSRRH